MGILVWTIAEYSAHRWVLHCSLWAHHRIHHIWTSKNIRLHPLIVAPVAMLLLIAGATFLSKQFVAGFFCAYLYYELFHFGAHRWFHIAWHKTHHENPAKNFGVTSTLWDKALGTC